MSICTIKDIISSVEWRRLSEKVACAYHGTFEWGFYGVDETAKTFIVEAIEQPDGLGYDPYSSYWEREELTGKCELIYLGENKVPYLKCQFCLMEDSRLYADFITEDTFSVVWDFEEKRWMVSMTYNVRIL